MSNLFDYSHTSTAPRQDWQDQLRIALTGQYANDLSILRQRGIWPPPWMNEDFIIQKDEGRLLAAIADNFGLRWSGHTNADSLATTETIGMTAVGNARAVIDQCVEKGYITARYSKELSCIMLDLTELGRDMLDAYEDDGEE